MRGDAQLVEWCSPSKSPGANMVSEAWNTDEKISAKLQNDDDDDCDEISVVSSSDSQVECDSGGGGGGGAMVLSDDQDRSPCFQNIEVTNSSDVHFGNKTYYQGPVTIKQILYSNPSQNNGEGHDAQTTDNNKLPITDISCDGSVNSGYVISETVNGVVKNSNGINNINSNNLSSNWTDKNKGKKWLQRRTSKQLILGTAILILLMISIIVITITLLTKYSPAEHNRNVYGETEPVGNQPDNDPEAIVDIIKRRSWAAEPPSKTLPLNNPVSKVIFTETLTENCTTQGDCIFIVRYLQTAHKAGQSAWDIRYNFLVGGDGNVYNGRGWNTMSAVVQNCNENSLGIAFIGTFSYDTPTEKQVNAAKRLLKMGAKQGHIRPDYEFVYASQLLGEDSSSPNLEEILKTWPHWSSENYFQDDALRQKFCKA